MEVLGMMAVIFILCSEYPYIGYLGAKSLLKRAKERLTKPPEIAAIKEESVQLV